MARFTDASARRDFPDKGVCRLEFDALLATACDGAFRIKDSEMLGSGTLMPQGESPELDARSREDVIESMQLDLFRLDVLGETLAAAHLCQAIEAARSG